MNQKIDRAEENMVEYVHDFMSTIDVKEHMSTESFNMMVERLVSTKISERHDVTSYNEQFNNVISAGLPIPGTFVKDLKTALELAWMKFGSSWIDSVL